MSSTERIALEAMAADWLERAKTREPSVRQIYVTCAEQLLAKLPTATGDTVRVLSGPWLGHVGVVKRVSNGSCALLLDDDPKQLERHHGLSEVHKLPKVRKSQCPNAPKRNAR